MSRPTRMVEENVSDLTRKAARQLLPVALLATAGGCAENTFELTVEPGGAVAWYEPDVPDPQVCEGGTDPEAADAACTFTLGYDADRFPDADPYLEAVPAEGWAFAAWVGGCTDAERCPLDWSCAAPADPRCIPPDGGESKFRSRFGMGWEILAIKAHFFPAPETLLAYEPFVYPEGPLDGADAGLGFAGPWADRGLRAGSTSVGAGSLELPWTEDRYQPNGGRYVQVGDGGSPEEAGWYERPVEGLPGDGAGPGTLYVSALLEATYDAAGGQAGIRLVGTEGEAFFGWAEPPPEGSGSRVAWALGSPDGPETAPELGPQPGVSSLLVLRVDFSGDAGPEQLALYAKPAYEEPDRAEVVAEAAIGELVAVGIWNTFSVDVDEIRVATDWRTAAALLP